MSNQEICEDLASIINIDIPSARKLLEKSHWNLEQAMENYLNQFQTWSALFFLLNITFNLLSTQPDVKEQSLF